MGDGIATPKERYWIAYEDDGPIGAGVPEDYPRRSLYYTDDIDTLRAFVDAVERRKLKRFRPRIIRVYTQYFDSPETGNVFELNMPSSIEEINNGTS